MSLDKQVNIYSIDTSAFYTYYEMLFIRKKYEFGIWEKIEKQEKVVSKIKTLFNKFKKENEEFEGLENTSKYKRYEYVLAKAKERLDLYNAIYNKRNTDIKFILNGGEIKVKKKVICVQSGLLEAKREYVNPTREILPNKISDKDGVSMFDSSLTRQLGLKIGKEHLNDELFIVRRRPLQ